jgi:hypothetical protein
MAPPRPEAIVLMLDELSRLVEAKGQKPRLVGLRVELEEGYRWLFGATHAQTQRRGERVHGGGGPGSGGPTEAVGASGPGERILNGKRVTTLHYSALDQCRRKEEAAAKKIREGVANLRGAASLLADCFKLIDEDTGHTPSEFFDAIPRQEEPDELDRVRAAQQRRTERGEVYAEDAQPSTVDHEQHAFKRQVVVRRDWRGMDVSVVVCRRCGEGKDHPVHDTPEIRSWRAFMEFMARLHRSRLVA